ncbi:MAG: hypothetical protein KKC20_19040 [Proteobacteria bacterium]|nr:hypothetical protein [Pseudomonadota bacterium]
MIDNGLKNPDLWKQKARAFVTRTHRHLWGKNNEDPQVFLFRQNLANQFVKEMHLGWNKHGQERTLEKWGLDGKKMAGGTFILPAGIVFPYIVEHELLAVWIHPLDPSGSVFQVPGSATLPIRLGNPMNPLQSVEGLFDGLRLFQAQKETLRVEIRP